MAIEKNCVKGGVTRFDSEISTGSRSGESMSSDGDELRRRNSGESEDDEDEFDDADSGAGSDDFDLLELGEAGSEFCQVGDQTCCIPFELYDLPDLRGVLSLEVWNECLTEEERFSLTKYLPDMDQETFMRSLKELFEGGNFHFGNPVDKMYEMLKGGLCEPRVALYRQGLNFLQMRQHYHLLRKHQDSLVASLLQMREAWQNCKGYGTEEKLRVLNIMRSQKSLTGERFENAGSDISERDESGEAMWPRRSKGRCGGQKVGHDPMYPVFDSFSGGSRVGVDSTRQGKQNAKRLLKAAGSNIHQNEGLKSLRHGNSVMRTGPYGLESVHSKGRLMGGDQDMTYVMESLRDWNQAPHNSDRIRSKGRSVGQKRARDPMYDVNIPASDVFPGGRVVGADAIRHGKRSAKTLLNATGLRTQQNEVSQFFPHGHPGMRTGTESVLSRGLNRDFDDVMPRNGDEHGMMHKMGFHRDWNAGPNYLGMDESGDAMRDIRSKGRTGGQEVGRGSMYAGTPAFDFFPGGRMAGVDTTRHGKQHAKALSKGGASKTLQNEVPQSFQPGYPGMRTCTNGSESMFSRGIKRSTTAVMTGNVVEHDMMYDRASRRDWNGVSDYSERDQLGEPMWVTRSKGRTCGQNAGRDLMYDVNPAFNVFPGGRVLDIDTTRHGKQNAKLLSKAAATTHQFEGHQSFRHGQSGMNIGTVNFESVLSRGVKGAEYGAMTGNGDAQGMMYDLASQRDWNVLHGNRMDLDRVQPGDNVSQDAGPSELPSAEVIVEEIQQEIKPPKKTYPLITPTIHTGFSFSVIHLLSAVRIALTTQSTVDSMEVQKNTENTGDKPENTDHKPENTGDKPENAGDKPENTGDKPVNPSDKPEDQKAKQEHANGSEQIDVNNPAPPEKTTVQSVTVHEIVNRVRSNPGDSCILETQEPLQDLVRGVLKIFSSKTAPLGAKSWKPLISYDKSRKCWSWIGPVPQPSTEDETPDEVTSHEAWGIQRKMLVKLVDSFANWLKSGQETLQQIGSLPAPPLELMQQNLDEKERFRDLRAQKSLTTISPSSDEVRAYFRKEEHLRYSIPDRAFSYTAADGKKSIVAPLRRCGGKPTSKARDHFMLKRDRPPHVTILCLVRDAAARLPGNIGTRADVCTLIRDSQYIVEEVTDAQVNQVVSGALDRLHYERDPCVQFDSERKLWVYLHRDREEEDFEDDGTSSTKKWRRPKKDATEQDEQAIVVCPETVEPSGLDPSSGLKSEPQSMATDKPVVYGDSKQRTEDDAMAEEGVMLDSNPHCLENSKNEGFDDNGT